MKRFAVAGLLLCLPTIFGILSASDVPLPEFRNLFNGKDLTGWVNVNTAQDTWRAKNGVLICSGHPIGVMRSAKQYENFVLHIEWMHIEPGGNSGVFVWSSARPDASSRLPDGIEVQMLELEWPNLHKQNGVTPPIAYVHGELFGVGGVKTVPDNPRGERSKSIENRCKGRGQWNTYDVVAIDGVAQRGTVHAVHAISLSWRSVRGETAGNRDRRPSNPIPPYRPAGDISHPSGSGTWKLDIASEPRRSHRAPEFTALM